MMGGSAPQVIAFVYACVCVSVCMDEVSRCACIVVRGVNEWKWIGSVFVDLVLHLWRKLFWCVVQYTHLFTQHTNKHAQPAAKKSEPAEAEEVKAEVAEEISTEAEPDADSESEEVTTEIV